ncbi:hypothetical protein Psi02_11700 [Planotetraspora silvatica]|uniref:Calcium-binding protein n=2 Tax=Planotetraspora silvatica TaxID=234614 RepID=A0A8J3UK45_9ACTN|nr:hypothetical protein Psi02_11700 [Planotetraspora silvatica]
MSPVRATAEAGATAGAQTLPTPPLPAVTVAGQGLAGDLVYADDQHYDTYYALPSAISADAVTIAYELFGHYERPGASTLIGSHVLNRKTGATVDLGDVKIVGLSQDGKKVVYISQCSGCKQGLYVEDLATRVANRLDWSYGGCCVRLWASFDGSRTAVFWSEFPHTTEPGDDGRRWYVRDLPTGVYKMLKDPEDPGFDTFQTGSAVSPGGRFIAYERQETSSGGRRVVAFDQVTGQYTRVTVTMGGMGVGGISNSGKLVFETSEKLVPQDTNSDLDIYVRDLVSGAVTLISTDEAGAAAGASIVKPLITADGRYVTYGRWRGGLESVFANLATGAQRVLTGLDGDKSAIYTDLSSYGHEVLALSRNGRYLAMSARTEAGRPGIVLRDQAQDCAGDFVTATGSGSEPLYGSPFDDVLYGSPGQDTIYGYGGNDVVCGLGGDDVVDGGPGDDALYGGEGDDRIEGNEGDDVVEGGVGADTLNGGIGTDALLYRYATAGVDVSLSRVTPNGMPGEGDLVFNDFEQIYGSAHDDTLSGRDNSEKLVGHAGDDLLLGMDGNDELWGGDGHDVLVGMAGDDYLNGGPGPSDSCAGGPGTNGFGDCRFTSNVP